MSCWAPRLASWRSTRSCRDRSDIDGSRPRDSSRTSRVRVYTSRASACRPLRYSASINNPASDSKVGSSATTGSRSPMTSGVPPERQRELGAFGHRSQPELGEAGGFGGGPLLGREVAERVTAPQRERVVVGLHVGRADTAVVALRGVRGGRARGPDAVGEVEGVDRRGVDAGAVPDPFAGDDVADPHGFEGATQLGDPDLQRVHRVDRQRRLRPQPVDEHGGRDGAAGAEEELGEQGAFGGAGQLHGCTVDPDLHRPEQPESHLVHCRSLRESTFIVLRG